MKPVRIGEHGLVLGAGMAGLVTARVLADSFDRVTVVDRDALPDGPEHRRGVPQGRHPHLLQAGGAQALDALFPGILKELESAGSALVVEDYSTFHFDLGGGRIVAQTGRPRDPMTSYLQTRPFLEAHVRRRLRGLPNVTIRDGVSVVDLSADDSGAVTGAIVLRDGAETIAADLIVDAMGRGGRTPRFLGGHGFPLPVQERVAARVTYSAQLLHWPIDTLPATILSVDPTPEHPIGMMLLPQENSTAWFWLVGMVGHEPPATFPEMIDFAERFPPPPLISALRTAPPIGPAARTRIPPAVWRRYDRLKTFPDGLLVVGDAIAAFNPAYGQGMSVAALQALSLQRCLAEGDGNLARRFFREAAKPTAAAWGLVAAGDLAYPQAEGVRSLQVRLSHLLEKPLLRAAQTDIEVYSQLLKVSAFVAPPSSLFSPSFLFRLLRGALRTTPEPLRPTAW